MSDLALGLELPQSEDLFSGFAPTSGAVRFTYSKPEDRLLKRLIVRGVERLTGQPRLERLYRDWSSRPHRGENIFEAAFRVMNITIDCNADALDSAPKTGPLLIIANHPFGVLDGLGIMAMATRIRPDVKILVHSLLCQPPETKQYLLPIDFSGTRAARETSATTRRKAVEWLEQGHCVVIFPAGGVSTSQSPFRGRAVDSAWHEFTARLTRVAGLKVLPVFFHGQNSRLFQIATHSHYTMRIALLFRESARRMGGSIRATIGRVIDAASLPSAAGKGAVMQYLRRATYALGGFSAAEADEEFQWPSHITFD